jgi:hypothetical protein
MSTTPTFPATTISSARATLMFAQLTVWLASACTGSIGTGNGQSSDEARRDDGSGGANADGAKEAPGPLFDADERIFELDHSANMGFEA